jgi:hypothetical protein
MINPMDDAGLLDFYLELHAQKWNLSPENLFIEHTTRSLLARWVKPEGAVCNIGIGAGEWDDYLGHWLEERGTLTSIDIDAAICDRLAYRQKRERHPFPARVIHTDLFDFSGSFDLVTMIGSTRSEIGEGAIDAALSLLKPSGVFFFMGFEPVEHAAITNLHREADFFCATMTR